jgi:hypothetical protein
VIRLAAPAYALPPGQVPPALAGVVRRAVELNPGERPTAKLGRTAMAIGHAFTPKSQHDRRVGLNPWNR